MGDRGVVATDIRIGRQAPPHGFHAYSLSFISATEGWALGRAPCEGRQCTYLLRTVDAGHSWSTAGSVPAQIVENNGACLGEQSECVGRILFVSESVGYAFEPSLLVTRDGGRSWQWLRGFQMHDMVATDRIPLRVAGAEPTADCSTGCHLQRSLDDGATWTDVPAAPVLHAAGVYVRTGDAAHLYLVGVANAAGGAWDKHAELLESEDGGNSWRGFPDPCADRGFTLDLEAAPANTAVALCAELSNGSYSGSVVVSRDGARTFSTPRPAPGGTPERFAVGSADTFAAAVDGIETTRDGGAHWQTTVGSCSAGIRPPWYPDGEAWSLGFVTPSVAHVLCPTDRLWTTNDGGEHWKSSRFDG
jgi:photosystem II stability/assembly factor-like uncharacterized protein